MFFWMRQNLTKALFLFVLGLIGGHDKNAPNFDTNIRNILSLKGWCTTIVRLNWVCGYDPTRHNYDAGMTIVRSVQED